MKQSTLVSVLLSAAIGMCSQLPGVASAASVKWYVGNNGQPTGACGTVCTKTNPCRSITQGVACSVPGDTVIVGPGLYSDDLDGDGSLGEPGEETASLSISGVTVVSRLGERSTGIAYTIGNHSITVQNAGGKLGVFGKKNKGFHISARESNATGYDVLVDGGGSAQGNKITLEPVSSPAPGNHVGFYVLDGKVAHCAVEGSANSPLGASGVIGFLSSSNVSVLDHNVAAGCATGFVVYGGTVTNNLAVANVPVAGAIPSDESGFQVVPFLPVSFEHNAAIGNFYAGLWIPFGTVTSLKKNSFYGNATGCGIRNSSGNAILAAHNYWGAATGPGANPADSVCDDSGTTTVTPFATTDYTPIQAAVK